MLNLALIVSRLAVAIILLRFALDWRSPFFASVRVPALLGFIALSLCLIAAEIWTLRRASRSRPVAALSAGTLVLAIVVLTSTIVLEGRFLWMRHQVLHADQSRLEKIGRHLIVGYRSSDELRALIERRAVAGVFIAAHNVKGKDAADIRREIDALQEIRRQQGLPPLWIATDQEGGGVSRMSPPLTQLPSLANIVGSHSDAEALKIAVREFAFKQGHELAGLGVNLNFAPVVDLNHRIVNPNDRYTRIHQRAISGDPQVVTTVAGEYCSALRQAGVRCTLKHFPGLGRVFEDTHLQSADLSTPVSTLMQTDWVPFRTLMHRNDTFTMLGHARLVDVDAKRPVSFSAPVIAGLLRGAWKHQGVLVTDDFSMEAAHCSSDGLTAAGVAALNAGVDLILISYDADQYYPLMHGLLQAEARGRLSQAALDRSVQRLAAAAIVNADAMVSAD